MGTSRFEPLPFVIETLQSINPHRVLDVGVGFGKIGLLIREYLEVWDDRVTPDQWQIQLEGIEVFPDYHKRSIQHLVYNKLHYIDVTAFDYAAGDYDLITCFDMIEHVTKEQGLALLHTFRSSASQVLISIPLGEGWLREGFGQNPHEHHLAQWDLDELQDLGYACLKRLQIPDGRFVGIFGAGELGAIRAEKNQDLSTLARLLESHIRLQFGQLAENTKSIVVWGTGKHSEFLLDVLPREALDRIAFFIDDGGDDLFYRWPVYRPEQVDVNAVDLILLSTDVGLPTLSQRASTAFPEVRQEHLYEGLDIETIAELKFRRLANDSPWREWLKANKEERMDAVRGWDLLNEGRWRFHLARYSFACRYTAGRRVADIASGTGYGSEVLYKRGAAQYVTGVDCDPEAVEYARTFHGSAGIKFIAANGQQTGLSDGQFDLVTSFETLEHVPDGEAFLAEFHRLLSPGGLLVISTPNQWPIAECPHHYAEYDLDRFLEVLEPWFDVDILFNQNSGGDGAYNRNQPAGIIETTQENKDLAECFIAVCRKKLK